MIDPPAADPIRRSARVRTRAATCRSGHSRINSERRGGTCRSFYPSLQQFKSPPQLPHNAATAAKIATLVTLLPLGVEPCSIALLACIDTALRSSFNAPDINWDEANAYQSRAVVLNSCSLETRSLAGKYPDTQETARRVCLNQNSKALIPI